jgi:hypothetical protein
VGEAGGLLALLIATVALSVLLVLISTATVGRILADLEYQYATGLDGVRRIQSYVNLRTHGNRVWLGLFALTVSILSLTDVSLLWRTWVGRLMFLAVLTSYAVSSCLDWRAERQQVRLLLRERERERERGPMGPQGIVGPQGISGELAP